MSLLRAVTVTVKTDDNAYGGGGVRLYGVLSCQQLFVSGGIPYSALCAWNRGGTSGTGFGYAKNARYGKRGPCAVTPPC